MQAEERFSARTLTTCVISKRYSGGIQISSYAMAEQVRNLQQHSNSLTQTAGCDPSNSLDPERGARCYGGEFFGARPLLRVGSD